MSRMNDMSSSNPVRDPSLPRRSISYQPLSTAKNEIRLLIINPDQDQDHDLHCRLEHESLFNLSADFVALSYHWGTSRAARPIYVSAQPVPVTRNLHNALTELRSRGIYRVWVDDLCINQYDHEENSQQILRMGAIYRSASRVLAHISSSDPLAQKTLYDLVRRTVQHVDTEAEAQSRVRRARREWERKQKKRKSGLRGMLLPQIIRSTDPPPKEVSRKTLEISEREKAALLQILKSPYWLRSWIIQEISVNFEMTIIWGSQDFDLDGMVKTFTELQTHLDGVGLSVWYHVHRLYNLRESQLASHPISLIDALGWCFRARASISRDRVFSLLGLTYDGPILVPIPTYASSEDEINRDMTLRVIRATRKLDFILSHRQDYSSWYPDWFDRKFWWYYDKSRNSTGTKDLRTHTRYEDPGSCGRYDTCRLTIQGKSLVVKGFFIGEIASCAPTLQESAASGEPQAYLVQQRAWGSETSSRPPLEVANRLFWMLAVIVKDKGEDVITRTTFRRLFGMVNNIHLCARWLLQWINCCEAQEFEISGFPVSTYLSERGTEITRKQGTTASRMIRKTLAADMRLGFTTEDRLGWFHRGATVGDKVAILLGSKTPCILRPNTSGGYALVGRCIVDGVMHGEAVKEGLQRLVDIRFT